MFYIDPRWYFTLTVLGCIALVVVIHYVILRRENPSRKRRKRNTLGQLDVSKITTSSAHEACLVLFKQLRTLTPYAQHLNVYQPITLPTSRYHMFVPYIEELLGATRKERKPNFADMSIARTQTSLEAFFITEDGHYGELDVLLDRFCGLVIEFCELMIANAQTEHGYVAYNRHQSLWLAYCLIECAQSLMPDHKNLLELIPT